MKKYLKSTVFQIFNLALIKENTITHMSILNKKPSTLKIKKAFREILTDHLSTERPACRRRIYMSLDILLMARFL